MKLTVVLDQDGNVVSTARLERPEGEAPDEMGLISEAGQSVYEIDTPDDFADLPGEELHRRVKERVKERPKRWKVGR